MKSSLKLVSWNVNGLRSIYQKGLIEFLNQEDPDITCLQEIKITEDKLNDSNLNFQPLSTYYSFAEKKGYSGLATMIKAGVPHLPKNLKSGIAIKRFDSEGRFLISDHKDFILYNTYFPSGTTGDERQSFKYDFLDNFLEHINSLPKAQKNKLIICGDINICHRAIDIHHPKTAEKRELSGFLPDERKWVDRFLEAGFTDAFRHIKGNIPHQYTWWSFRAGSRKKNLGWRIDYFFVANSLISQIKDARILSNILGSDHSPIVLELDF